MDKFGRIYDMRISTRDGGNITVQLPFTLQFMIQRHSMPDANVAQFKIYNLPRHIRDLIRFDISLLDRRQEVALKAGYKSVHYDLNDLPMIFRGSIKYAFSERVGTDWITTIECYDGGFALANSRIEKEFIKGEQWRSSMEKVLELMQDIKTGKLSPNLLPADKKTLRGHTVHGKIADVLNENFGCNWFIDNGIVNVLADDEALAGAIKVINISTGLLDTPVRQDTIIDFDMIFEPRLLVCQLISLMSETDPAFNGTYKLVSFKHQGTISDAVCGEAVTHCRVFKGLNVLKVVA
jgi:hypothetical protein